MPLTEIGPLERDDERKARIYYIIYSFDLTRGGEWLIDQMDPNRIGARGHRDDRPGLSGLWVLTEGDEQYEFDYLADEMGDRECEHCQGDGGSSPWQSEPGYARWSVEFGGMGPITACEHCAGSGVEKSKYREGFHRKWVGELTHDEFLTLCNDRGIDLDEDERPERFTDTMGSITEYGLLPAYCIEDDEGWTYGGEVIYASFYISEGHVPMGAFTDLTESEAA